MTHLYLAYAITELYCAVFAVTIWFRLNYSIGSEYEVRQLRNMIYAYLVMLGTDIVWALYEDGSLHMPRLPYMAVNGTTVMAVACGCYFWFRFIEAREHFAFAANKTLNTLLVLPLLAVCTMDVVSIFNGCMFYLDAQGHYSTTLLFELQGVVDYFYLVVPTGYSLRLAVRTQSRQERAEYLTYACYMIAPLAAGLLEDVFLQVPLLALNILLMILILFLMIQNRQVFNDALTGLNNRRRLNLFLAERLAKAAPNRPLCLFIMDINRFKSINDAYGHLEGDNALRCLAGVLKDFGGQYGAFAARYGGDEFCLVTEDLSGTPARLAAELQRRLQEAQTGAAAQQKPYTLTVSVGYAVCDGAETEPGQALARADAMLYVNKRAWHRAN